MNADEFFKWKREMFPKLESMSKSHVEPHRPQHWAISHDELCGIVSAIQYLERLQDTTTPRIPLAKVTEPIISELDLVRGRIARGETRLEPIREGSNVMREVRNG